MVRRLKYEAEGPRFADWSHVLLDQALLAEGAPLEDPAAFVKRMNQLMLALAGDTAD
jgi:molecular chaperone HtpG